MLSKEKKDRDIFGLIEYLVNCEFKDKAIFTLSSEVYSYERLRSFNVKNYSKNLLYVESKLNEGCCRIDLDSGIISMDDLEGILSPADALTLAQLLVFLLNKTVRLIKDSRVICLFELPDKVECEEGNICLSESTVMDIINNHLNN